MKILMRDVRLAFPSLWKPSAPKAGGEAAFSASFLFPKTHPQYAELQDVIRKVASEKWADKAPGILKAMVASDKLCLHNGDAKEAYEGFSGMLYISARSKVRPTVIDQRRADLVEADGKPYSGCYVNAQLELWAQDNSYGKRINAQLRGVQFLRDGDAFAGGSRPADADEFPEEIAAEGSAPAEAAAAQDNLLG